MDEKTLENYRRAGEIAKAARDYGASKIKEGVLLLEVAEDVEEFMRKEGAKPAFPINLALNDAAAITLRLMMTNQGSTGEMLSRWMWECMWMGI